MSESLVLARPSSASFTLGGESYDLTKLLDGDYLSLSLTSGEVINFVKGIGGNAAGAINMQNTISNVNLRIMQNDPFAMKVLEMVNDMQNADGSSFSSMTITDIELSFFFEYDGELIVRKFGASYGVVSSFPVIRANASGDATQAVYQIVLKMPGGCKFKGQESV